MKIFLPCFRLHLSLHVPSLSLLCFLFSFLFSVSLSFHLTFLSSSPSLPALSLPPCLKACPWELFCVCKLLAWLQQYLKLCHKSCCQTNRLALGQPGSVVFFSFFFLPLSWSSLERGVDQVLFSAAQPVALGFRWPDGGG